MFARYDQFKPHLRSAAFLSCCSTMFDKLAGCAGGTGWAGEVGGVAAVDEPAAAGCVASTLPPDWLAKEASNKARIVDQLKTMRMPKMMPMMSLMLRGVFLRLGRVLADQCGSSRTFSGLTWTW